MKKTLSKLETRDNLKYFKISLQQPIQWNVRLSFSKKDQINIYRLMAFCKLKTL